MNNVLIFIVIYVLLCIFTLYVNYYNLEKNSTLWDFLIFKNFEQKVGLPAWIFITPFMGTICCALAFGCILLCLCGDILNKLKPNIKNKLLTYKIK